MKNLVSASLLAANKNELAKELQRLEENDIELVHFDVMDNVFVPNTSFNDDTFNRIRKYSKLNFEVHLMVENPFNYINNYEFDKNDIIIVHYESFKSSKDLLKCLEEIKKTHKVGLSIKPKTEVKEIKEYLSLLDYVLVMSVEPGFGGQKFMPDALRKIEELHNLQNGNHYVIEVDGGINEITGPQCVKAGVDILVSGSYLFKEDMKERGEAIKCEK